MMRVTGDRRNMVARLFIARSQQQRAKSSPILSPDVPNQIIQK